MRHQQSGIFGLSALISLAIYAALAVAALGAIYAFDRSRQAIGEQKAEARLQPIIQACNVDRDAAVAANKTLQADVDQLFILTELQNREVEKWKTESDRARAAKAANIAATAAKDAALATAKFDLVVAYNAPDRGGTCEQKLAYADALLRAAAVQRMRDFPNATSGIGDKDGRAGKGAGADALFIR